MGLLNRLPHCFGNKSAKHSRILGYLTAVYAVGQMVGPAIADILSSFTQSYDYALTGAAGAVLFGAVLLITGIRNDQVQNTGIFTSK